MNDQRRNRRGGVDSHITTGAERSGLVGCECLVIAPVATTT